jgi:hypothetical protein
MKKIAFLFIFALVGLLYSCGTTTTDPLPSPATSITISVPSNVPTTAKVGDRITFSVGVTAPATLSKFEVRKGAMSIDNASTFTGTTFTYNFAYTVTAQDAGQNLAFRFIAEDIKGNSKSVDVAIAVAVVVTPSNDVRLLSQNATATIGAAVGSFYVSADNLISNTGNADPAKVDITYGVLSNNATLVSPDARVANNLGVAAGKTGWTRTTFAVSNLNFDTVTATEITNAAAPTNVLQTVTVGGVYIFQNAANKRGIIRVKSLPTNGNGVDVVFDIKVIK